MTRHVVDRMLEEAAAHVRYPATPDLVEGVLLRIEEPGTVPVGHKPRLGAAAGAGAGAARPWSRAGGPGLRRRSVVVAVVAVTIAGVVTLGAAFGVHDAVAGWLGIGAVEIETVPLPADLPGRLDLGDPVSLEEAVDAASIEVLVPEALGDPGLVLIDQAGQVSLAYGMPADSDPATGIGIGTLVTFLDGDFGPWLTKLVDTGITDITQVDVASDAGLWLEGGPHVVVRTDPTGNDVVAEGRLAANTLLWVRNGTTVRIETPADLATALTVAESLQPVR